MRVIQVFLVVLCLIFMVAVGATLWCCGQLVLGLWKPSGSHF